MKTLFDECKEALSRCFYFLSSEEEKLILNEFKKYPFKYGEIEYDIDVVEKVDFFHLLELINEKKINSYIYVLPDTKGIPFFRTNLLLALDNIDDISALSTRIFFLGDGYLAQVEEKNPPLSVFRLR